MGAVPIARQYPFTAERKMMSTLVALDPANPINGPVRLYVTGVYACVCP
jgi:magnesium-transporting ATPase (P-type)